MALADAMRASEQGAAMPAFRPPGPGSSAPSLPLLSRIRRTIENPIEAWPRAVYEARAWRPPFPGAPVFLMDPAAIKAVLVENAEDFPHGALFKRVIAPFWGRGLLAAEGPEWRWQRRAAAPAFRAAQMAALAPRMRGAAEAALARWEAKSDWDIAAETAAITFDVVLDTILSGGEDFDRATLRARIEAFLAEQGRMKATYFFASDAFHAGRVNTESAEGLRLRAEIDRMVLRRRAAAPRGDLVDLLMAAEDPESGRPMDDKTLRDNLLGFIVAGFGTSAVALAWALYLVSEHAPTAARLRSEVDAATGGGPVEASHVEQLVFTRAVVSEAMRLYPPAHTLTRVAGRAIEVGGTTIAKGARVIVPIYALHRHTAHWRDPDIFDPDRFMPGAPPVDRHVYMPFGAGPRICLGAAFAMTELVVVLATLVRGARFAMRPAHEVAPVAGLALQPRGGLPMRVSVAGRSLERLGHPG